MCYSSQAPQISFPIQQSNAQSRSPIMHMPLMQGAIECVSACMLVGVQQEAAPGVREQAETHQKVRVLLNTTGALLSPITVITKDKQRVL